MKSPTCLWHTKEQLCRASCPCECHWGHLNPAEQKRRRERDSK